MPHPKWLDCKSTETWQKVRIFFFFLNQNKRSFHSFTAVFEPSHSVILAATVHFSAITHNLGRRTIRISDTSDTYETNFIIGFVSNVYYNWIIRFMFCLTSVFFYFCKRVASVTHGRRMSVWKVKLFGSGYVSCATVLNLFS